MSEKIAVHTPTKESKEIIIEAYKKKGWVQECPSNDVFEYGENCYIDFHDKRNWSDKHTQVYYKYKFITVEEALARLGQYERGQEVLVKRDGLNWMKRIYLTTIDGAECPYVTVGLRAEKKYKSGEPFGMELFQYIKPLEEPIKEMTMQEVETALGHKVKIVK